MLMCSLLNLGNFFLCLHCYFTTHQSGINAWVSLTKRHLNSWKWMWNWDNRIKYHNKWAWCSYYILHWNIMKVDFLPKTWFCIYSSASRTIISKASCLSTQPSASAYMHNGTVRPWLVFLCSGHQSKQQTRTSLRRISDIDSG